MHQWWVIWVREQVFPLHTVGLRPNTVTWSQRGRQSFKECVGISTHVDWGRQWIFLSTLEAALVKTSLYLSLTCNTYLSISTPAEDLQFLTSSAKHDRGDASESILNVCKTDVTSQLLTMDLISKLYNEERRWKSTSALIMTTSVFHFLWTYWTVCS